MTYAQYEKDHFIHEIDVAMTKLNSLEAKKAGTPQSEFSADIDAVNRRIWQMENGGTTTTTTATTKPAAAAAAGGNLVALQARRNQLCSALGIDPKFQAESKTVEEFQTQIARLEARQKAQQTAPTVPVVPVKPVTATVAATMTRFKTGRTTGLERAIGAATVRANS